MSEKIQCSYIKENGEQCGNKKLKNNIPEDKRENWKCHQHREDNNKTNDIGKNKLNENQKEHMVLWLAEGRGPTEIVGLIKEKFGIKYDKSSVSGYKKRHKDEIQEKQQELNEYISINVSLANKFQRVKELETIYNESLKQNDLREARKTIKDIAEEMGDLEENININTDAKEGILEAYKRRKQEEK